MVKARSHDDISNGDPCHADRHSSVIPTRAKLNVIELKCQLANLKWYLNNLKRELVNSKR